MQAVHNSPFRGSWYPESAGELERLLDDCFAASCARTGPYLIKDAIGFVTPHAGPAYSGCVAAAVYRAIQRLRPEQIVVLAFPHSGGLRGIAVPDVKAIATPLGEVEIHAPLDDVFPRVDEDRVCDHSLEIQLPFLQKAAPAARIAPLYAGAMDAGERRSAAALLAEAWRPGVVFLASSDFTHYGRNFGYMPFPVDGSIARRLHELDFDCIDSAGSLDSSLFLEMLRRHDATVCGRDPIALLLDILDQLGKDEIYQSVLDYQTSGEITGDYHHSVSYAALAYSRRSAFELSAADREALLDAASETLCRLRERGVRQAVRARGTVDLESRPGVFVTLHHGTDLVGCIGNCAGREQLATLACEMAMAAALDDPRFRPAASLAGAVDMEISVLTPFRRIRSAGQFSLGRHGGTLDLGGRSGLLLPQVGAERGWTAEQFLDALARKSLLGPHAWKDPKARLRVFEAQVFSRKGI